jgi:hypothetical protein
MTDYTEDQIDEALAFVKKAYFQGWSFDSSGSQTRHHKPGTLPDLGIALAQPERYELRPAPRMIQLWEFCEHGELGRKWVPAPHTEVGVGFHIAREGNLSYRKLGPPIPYPGDAE